VPTSREHMSRWTRAHNRLHSATSRARYRP